MMAAALRVLSRQRFLAASRASALHFLGSLLVAAVAAALVFVLWYPYPYRELAGGRGLFLLVVAVDVVCGPLLTAVLFNPAKPRAELWRDLGIVVAIQLVALGYGLHTVWLARPLYLVMEKDRFKVIKAVDLVDVAQLSKLSPALQPRLTSGPQVVALREPKDADERKLVLVDSVLGGRDYAERPEFYMPYDGEAAIKSLAKARPLSAFLERYPAQREIAQKLASKRGQEMTRWVYLPVVGRQDWIAILDNTGQIQGFLPGDGF